ncbi:MAG: TSUP family transporter [Oscillospiraceae bacterium]|nr:TSUP family transporter [Oscillospiraceae bacterium]
MAWNIVAAFFSGMAASLGLGGGGILLLYLVLALNMEQLQAQGINLIFFLPCAVIAIIFYTKKRLIDWKAALPILAGGLLGVGLGVWIAGVVTAEWLARIFGGFLLLLGLREFFFRKTKSTKKRK